MSCALLPCLFDCVARVLRRPDHRRRRIDRAHTYDAWGNLLSTTGSLAETLGKLNPLRYRGYVYDFETGLYYLQSRYYNPKTGRFLNADAFASTGQGLLGYNMFAYCGNNPVNRADSTGQFWLEVLIVAAVSVVCAATLSGCSAQPTSDVGCAAPYVEMSGSQDRSAPNCYAYAIGADFNIQPGCFSRVYPTDYSNVENVAMSVKADLKKLGFTVRRIDGPNSKVYENEYKIALRVGTSYVPNEEFYDYHFMRQTNTGQWAEKHGPGGESVLWDPGMTPETIPWTIGKNGPIYYDSEIVYFAIGRER